MLGLALRAVARAAATARVRTDSQSNQRLLSTTPQAFVVGARYLAAAGGLLLATGGGVLLQQEGQLFWAATTRLFRDLDAAIRTVVGGWLPRHSALPES